jgi:hypothetical protein
LKTAAAKGMHINLEDMIEFAKDGIVSKTLVKTAGREISLFCSARLHFLSQQNNEPATEYGENLETLSQR